MEPARKPTFEEVYQAELRGLVGLATFMLGSRQAAEDAVQDAFLKLHTNWFEVDTPGAYVRRVVVNRCRDLLRSEKRSAARLRLIHDPTVSSVQHDVDLHTDLVELLKKLEPRRRMVVVLRFFGHYQLREIADMLDMPQKTVESNLYRGLDQLGRSLPDAFRV